MRAVPCIFFCLSLLACQVEHRSVPENQEAYDDSAYVVEVQDLLSEEEEFDVYSFLAACDSLLKALKGERYHFELQSDTVYFGLETQEQFPWQHGIFRPLLLDTSEWIIRHRLYSPGTREQLRIYLAEAQYTHPAYLDNVLAQLEKNMLDSLSVTGNAIFIRMGLSPVKDYIAASEKKLFWLNVGYPYSNENFFTFVDVLKHHIDTSAFVRQIICLAGKDCQKVTAP